MLIQRPCAFQLCSQYQKRSLSSWPIGSEQSGTSLFLFSRSSVAWKTRSFLKITIQARHIHVSQIQPVTRVTEAYEMRQNDSRNRLSNFWAPTGGITDDGEKKGWLRCDGKILFTKARIRRCTFEVDQGRIYTSGSRSLSISLSSWLLPRYRPILVFIICSLWGLECRRRQRNLWTSTCPSQVGFRSQKAFCWLKERQALPKYLFPHSRRKNYGRSPVDSQAIILEYVMKSQGCSYADLASCSGLKTGKAPNICCLRPMKKKLLHLSETQSNLTKNCPFGFIRSVGILPGETSDS